MATTLQIGTKYQDLPTLPSLPAHRTRQRRHHGPRTDYLIAQRRREEENRLRMVEQTRYYEQTSRQSFFEESSNEAIKRNRVIRRFEELKMEENSKVEERRERLRLLLAQDEERYRTELASTVPTRESRIEAMRARVNELKAKREQERQQVVEEKLLQKWRNECDELRAVESQILEREVANIRAVQLIEQDEKRALAAQEKKYYDDLWEQDRLKKIEREEADRVRRKAMNAAVAATLEEQLNTLRLHAQEEVRLRQEEAALMRQEMELRKLEEERAHFQKLASQRAVRLELDAFNKAKIRARQREVQQALELDMKIVNAFFRMDEQEKESKNRRKEELKKEMKLYMDHLREQQMIEKEREREIERLYAEEAERLWRARAEKWAREQRARDHLMQEVLAGRQEQLLHSLNQNRIHQEEIEREKHVLEQQVAQARAQELTDREKHSQDAENYRNALMEQVKMADDRRKAERERERELDGDPVEDHERYKELLQQEIARAYNLPRVRAFRASNRDAGKMTTIPLVATVVGSGLQK